MLNKKGNVIQLFFILGAILVFIFTGVFGLKILNSFGEAYASVGEPEGVSVLEDGITGYGIFDFIVPIVIFLLLLMFIVSAFYIKTHPAFFFISLILLGIVVIGSSSFSNLISALSQVEGLENETNTFNDTIVISENFPIIFTFSGFLFMVVLYSLWRKG